MVVLTLALCGCSGSTSAKSDTPGGGSGKGGGRRGMGGDVPVTVATAKERDVPVEIQVIGNVEAYSTITVKAQVGGLLTDVFFHEGDFVKKGEKLFTIDKRPLEAAYNQALANIARDQASLGQAQANLARDQAQAKYQETQAKRYAELTKSGVISRDQSERQRGRHGAGRQRGQGRHPERPGGDRREHGNGGELQSPARLHRHLFAHRRTHRQSDGETGERGSTQYH
jgi:multidrug efflux system membrane fusion protein